MNHGSLFSGIGGFDLAAEWSGFTNLFNCEWEEFPRKVLKHHFPNAEQFGDIKEFNATTYSGRIDILSGGFPCQPFSVAGKRKGTEDERYLWKEMFRVIRECQPRWVVGENVRGLVNWSDGLVFETCCSDLEALGYSVQSFIVPACAVNAPHRRDRVWIVAHSDNIRTSSRLGEVQSKDGEIPERNNDAKPSDTSTRNASDTQRIRLEHTEKPRSLEKREGETRLDTAKPIETNGERRNAPNTDNEERNGRCSPSERERQEAEQRGNGIFSATARLSKKRNAPDTDSARTRQDNRQRESGQLDQKSENNDWKNFPTVAPVCGGNDGLPKELDGITFSKWRRESIKGYGNAIVPQVAHRIFESIKDYEKRKKSPPPCEELSSHHGER